MSGPREGGWTKGERRCRFGITSFFQECGLVRGSARHPAIPVLPRVSGLVSTALGSNQLYCRVLPVLLV